MTTTIDSVLNAHSSSVNGVSPAKLALLKLHSTEGLNHGVLSEPGSPIFERRNMDFDTRTEGGRAITTMRSHRRVGSTSRRASSFIQGHRSKMSQDLTTQAESKFFALMEFMSSASKEASSLREYWSRLMAERESFAKEREQLLMQIDEVSETLERQESSHHHHEHELGERRREVEKLIIELSTALSAVDEQKKLVSVRDQELGSVRKELVEFQSSMSHSRSDFDRTRADFEALELRIKQIEAERDHARGDVEKYRNDLRSLTREHTDLTSRNVDLTTKVDLSRKEVSSLIDRIKVLEREKEESLLGRDRLLADVRRATSRADEATRELTEMTDRHDRAQREANNGRETIRQVTSERDDNATTIELLRHQLKSKSEILDQTESDFGEFKLKYESSKREVITAQDQVRTLEADIVELRSSIDRKSEEYRHVAFERDAAKDDLEEERRKLIDSHQQVAMLQEKLVRTEALLVNVQAEVTTVTDRLHIIEVERDSNRDSHIPLHAEITDLKEKLAVLQAEYRNTAADRDRAHKQRHDAERKFEEVTETITSYGDSSRELEFEIDSLRTMLKEMREQKEMAISARTTADRERDEYMSKYEEKCREMERREESRSSFYASHGHSSSHAGGRMSSTRTVTRSSAVGHSHEGQESVNEE